MKKNLLIIIVLLSSFIAHAQRHLIATPIKVKPLTRINQAPTTQKPMAAACDTIKYDSAFDATNPWGAFYYPFPYDNWGYEIGVNNPDSIGFNILEDANFYDVSGSDYTYITGGLAFLAYANSSNPANLSKNLYFKIYSDLGGFPNQLIGLKILPLNQAHQVLIDGLRALEFQFDNAIPIPANKRFYVSIDHENFHWNASARDSIAITADSSDEAPASAYQYIDASISQEGIAWHKVSEFWPADNNNDPLDIDLFLFPYVNNSATGCTTLPVSILNFKGAVVNNQPILSWSTATEFNDKGFAIERSKDGKIFAQIGFVNGSGTTSQRRNYTYTDVTSGDIGVATCYYRLKQIDLDGKTNYSNVIPLSLKNALDWKIYPNPVKDKITIALNLTTDTKVNVQVISKDGRLLLNTDKGTLPQGQQEINLNMQNIASGSYFVRVKAGDKYYTQTIVKQ
ncbi:MAG TPA: T9SS type A sorting domain-containing protein [Parafilimonas sp.]|nr:T9SS type A sorting domain-containing protein [Parafilimonas sp.]